MDPDTTQGAGQSLEPPGQPPRHPRAPAGSHPVGLHGQGRGGQLPKAQEPTSGGGSTGVVGAELGPLTPAAGSAVSCARELLEGALSWGARGNPPPGLSGPAGRRSRREALRPDRKEASVIMAAVSAIQPRSPLAAAATEAAAATRELGASATGPGSVTASPGFGSAAEWQAARSGGRSRSWNAG